MALELSLFFDESRLDAMDSKYYLLTIVLHDQSTSLAGDIAKYEHSLRDKGLADVPFHASPLMNGHDDCRNLDAATRKRMLSTFRVFFRHLPIRHRLIKLKMKENNVPEKIETAMRQALVDFWTSSSTSSRTSRASTTSKSTMTTGGHACRDPDRGERVAGVVPGQAARQLVDRLAAGAPVRDDLAGCFDT